MRIPALDKFYHLKSPLLLRTAELCFDGSASLESVFHSLAAGSRWSGGGRLIFRLYSHISNLLIY